MDWIVFRTSVKLVSLDLNINHHSGVETDEECGYDEHIQAEQVSLVYDRRQEFFASMFGYIEISLFAGRHKDEEEKEEEDA